MIKGVQLPLDSFVFEINVTKPADYHYPISPYSGYTVSSALGDQSGCYIQVKEIEYAKTSNTDVYWVKFNIRCNLYSGFGGDAKLWRTLKNAEMRIQIELPK